jgi:hypothetical protein
VRSDGFCGRDGVRNDRGGAARWESAVFVDATGWGSTVGVGSSGWGSTVFVGATGWGSAVSGRSTGCETIVVARRAARGCDALVGGLAGIASAVEVSTWQRGAILDSPYPDTILAGTTMGHGGRWWPHDEPSRAVVAARGHTTRLAGNSHPHLARIGVGAVQNRRTGLGDKRDVTGDAGQPAHQRHATPHCAPPRHVRIAPVCGPTTRRFAPVCGTAMRRFAPVCDPTARRFAPRYPPTPQNPALRAAPRCADPHPSAAPRRVNSHPDTHQRPKTPRCARHHHDRFAPR